MSSICFPVTSKLVVPGAPPENNKKTEKEMVYLDRKI